MGKLRSILFRRFLGETLGNPPYLIPTNFTAPFAITLGREREREHRHNNGRNDLQNPADSHPALKQTEGGVRFCSRRSSFARGGFQQSSPQIIGNMDRFSTRRKKQQQ